jgi:hypothetical protein
MSPEPPESDRADDRRPDEEGQGIEGDRQIFHCLTVAGRQGACRSRHGRVFVGMKNAAITATTPALDLTG